MKILKLLPILLLVVATGCQKASTVKDCVLPMFELVYPKDIPSLQNSQPLCIKAIVTDNEQLFSLYWEIIESSTGKKIKNKEILLSSCKSYVVDEKFIIPEHFKGDYLLQIFAGDLEGNQSNLGIPFKVNN